MIHLAHDGVLLLFQHLGHLIGSVGHFVQSLDWAFIR